MKIYLIAALLLATLVAVPCLAEEEAKVEKVEQVADVPETAAGGTGTEGTAGLDKPEDTAEAKIPEELQDEVEREKRAVPQLSDRSCVILKRYGYCNNAGIARFCVKFCCQNKLSAVSCQRVRVKYRACNQHIGRVYCRKTCGHCRPKPNLPAQCKRYRTINDVTRRQSIYRKNNYKCDNRVLGWSRFVGRQGTYIYNKCPSSEYRCGTAAPGWVNGKYPTKVGQTVVRYVCFRWARNCCKWKVLVNITHCRSFYVFYLRKAPTCTLRYCGNL